MSTDKIKKQKNKKIPKLSYKTLWKIYRRFAGLYKKHWLLLSGAYTGLLLRIGIALLLPWPIKLILDYVILKTPLPPEASFFTERMGTEPLTLLVALVVSYFTLRFISMFVSYLHKVGLLTVGERMTADIREQLFWRMQRLSLSFHGQAKSADLVYRLTSDINKIKTILVIFPDLLIHRFVIIVSHLGIIYYYNWQLALLASLILPALYAYNSYYGSRVEDAVEKKRLKESDVSAIIAENVTAMALVQAYGRQDYQQSRLSKQNRAGLEYEIEAMRLSKIFKRLNAVLISLGTALVVGYGGWLAMSGILLPGTLVLFTYYVRNLYKPISKLADMVLNIAKSQVSGKRLLEVLESDAEIVDSPGAIEAPRFKGTVSFEKVSFGYSAENPVLKDISFIAKPGEKIALVGHSGAEKTTLINLLMRFYDPQSGQVLIDGKDIKSYKIKSLRDQSTFLMQDGKMFYKSVADNIAFGKEGATREEVEAAAKEAQAHSFILDMPDGYDTIIEEEGENISGGQKQRINIARALIRNTPIIIFDEPTTALDAKAEALVHTALSRLTRQKTTFIIAHKFSTILDADKIIVLDKGDLVGIGTHDELLASCAPYQELCRWQFGDGDPEKKTDAAVSNTSAEAVSS